MENSADALKGQTIRVECNGTSQQISIDYGDFDVVLSVVEDGVASVAVSTRSAGFKKGQRAASGE